jgi:hypothetical protein
MAQRTAGIERATANGVDLELQTKKLTRPSPLGLFGFATTTLVLGLYMCNTGTGFPSRIAPSYYIMWLILDLILDLKVPKANLDQARLFSVPHSS